MSFVHLGPYVQSDLRNDLSMVNIPFQSDVSRKKTQVEQWRLGYVWKVVLLHVSEKRQIVNISVPESTGR